MNSNSKLRYLTIVVRVLLGLAFFVDGLNGLVPFLPQPSVQLAPRAMDFVAALTATGYMLKLIAVTQLVVGALLLVNRFVPLALVLLAPFMVNSIAFHACLERTGLPMALVILVLQLYLVWQYRSFYCQVLTAKARPGSYPVSRSGDADPAGGV